MTTSKLISASYLGPEGFGNSHTGLRAWPEELAGPLGRGELDGLHWSLMSDSDPSRFLRMDLMCRLGFMAAELLAANFDAMPDAQHDRVGVCVESFSGCLDTDVRFLQTPRPSLFAYTLPSTVIGEICIRYRLKGPVLNLISTTPGAPAALTEANAWIADGTAEMVLCLTIEAVNRATRDLLGWPLPEWQASAVLLSSAGGPTPVTGSLIDVCRESCGV